MSIRQAKKLLNASAESQQAGRKPSGHVHARQPVRVSAPGPLWGGVLGWVLLGWCVLMVAAPEIGSLVGVFGSPVLALFVIVRLLTPGSAPHDRR
jgi:hypothetical protein